MALQRAADGQELRATEGKADELATALREMLDPSWSHDVNGRSAGLPPRYRSAVESLANDIARAGGSDSRRRPQTARTSVAVAEEQPANRPPVQVR